jgi:Zn-dependent protease with chaperone function
MIRDSFHGRWKRIMPSGPSPLPYHRAIVDHLLVAEPGLWNWFASTRPRAAEADAVRLELLRTTYRLDSASQPALYEHAEAVRAAMQLTCGITIYQSQSGSEANASLAYLPAEAHIVFSGPLTGILSGPEIRAVLAHELAHFQLFELGAGEFLAAADLLRALALDATAGPAAAESARLFNLWTEIYADRWACHVSDDVTVAIAALLKTTTGLADVDPDSYLRQAEEIVSKRVEKTDQISHPETYIRARALRLWAEQGHDAHAEIDSMIGGGLGLQRIDLLGQKRATDFTRQFLVGLLAPTWFRSEAVLAHANRFFPDFPINDEPVSDSTLTQDLEAGDDSLRDYACYLLLDFASVDREMGDPAVAAALVFGRRLGIQARFAELAQKELGIGKKAFARLDRDAESLLAKTADAHQP